MQDLLSRRVSWETACTLSSAAGAVAGGGPDMTYGTVSGCLTESGRGIPLPCSKLLFLSFVFCLLAGCASFGGLPRTSGPSTGPAQMSVGTVVETGPGRVISFDDLIGELSEASVVYVGETHTSMEDHKAQLDILRRLTRSGECTELGMEMFPRNAQPVLDRYFRGETTEEEFLREVRWEEVWGFPFQLYRGLIDYARNNRIRIVGLNAPQHLVRKIGREGLSSLTPEERVQLARDFHLDDPKNRKRMQAEYAVHGKDRVKSFEAFLEAQLAWEETMAETLAERLGATGGKCRIVVILGKGHMTDRLGVPHLAPLRTPHTYKTVAPLPFTYPLSTFDPNLADYVLLTDKPGQVHRPVLGVTVQPAPSGRGTEILDVLPNTPAAKSDIRKGDVILTIDARPVNSIEDIRRALAESGPSHKVEVLRGRKKMTIDVLIPQQMRGND